MTAGVKDVREVDRAGPAAAGRARAAARSCSSTRSTASTRPSRTRCCPRSRTACSSLIGATTENPYFEVNPPLLPARRCSGSSRSTRRPSRALLERGLEAEGATADDDAVDHLVDRAGGDGRHALTALEVAVALAAERRGRPRDAGRRRGRARRQGALRYGRDEHYDVIAAFIKSIRGSDPDAGLYWLARMLEAGEDARFIARRLVILASRGHRAWPTRWRCVVADAAAHAVEFVGLPEAQLNLAQAVVHLATAPEVEPVGRWRSGGPRPTCRSGPAGEVPIHLRDAHYRGAATLGHGEGYEYPHDDPAGWVAQEYRPAEVADRRYYEPSAHGCEAGDRRAHAADARATTSTHRGRR